MNAKELYKKLDDDFITPEMSDKWVTYMDSVSDYLCDNFKEREMGLVCDFSEEVTQVYTAVFPSEKVMKKILDGGAKNALLFTHHPSVWDIRKPEIFYQMDQELLEEFKRRKISLYTLHVPLDAYGEYATSVSLAKALDLKIEKPFAPYHGVLAGVICKVSVKTVGELQERYEKAVGHGVKLYQYGDNDIRDGRVAVVAGGGNDMDVVRDVVKEGVNTLVTGVTVKNEFSTDVHDIEKKENINLLGGTHYSSEKFVCMTMCDYFKGLGLKAEFLSDEPVFADM